MAFGLGYNKTKILSAAEKYVMQGKIPAAIAEYSKILENEPRDLIILNLVGDLFLRVNKNEEAMKCFFKLGEAYLDDGFTRNAIAAYRRILRADAAQINAIMRLAELYTLQGQLNDARSYYNQAVEYYGKRNDTEKCVDAVEKTLLLDPDNFSLKQRLAALYQEVNRKEEAAALYLAVCEGLADQGKVPDADKALKTAKQLGASGPQVTQLEARVQLDSGRPKEALALLSTLPPEGLDKVALNLLFHANCQVDDLAKAAEVAARLLTEHEDVAGLAMICEKFLEQSRYDEALANYQIMAESLIASRNTSPLIDGAKRILAARPSEVGALKLLRQVYERSDQYAELSDVDERLGEAAEQQGDVALAREVYAELVRLHPDGRVYEEKLRALSGAAARPPEHMEAERSETGFGDGFYAPPPVVEQTLTPQEQELVQTALTESDLYITYRQIDKAIQPLEAALDRLPTDITLNERLIELYQRAGQQAKVAERAAVLVNVLEQAGDTEKAADYRSMAQRFASPPAAEAAPLAEVGGSALPEFSFGPAEPVATHETEELAPAPQMVVPSEAGVQEVDLSDWEAMMGGHAPGRAAQPITDLASGAQRIEEYIAAGQISEASTALSELQERFPGSPELDSIAERVAMAAMGMTPEPVAPPAETPVEAALPPEPIFAPFEMPAAEAVDAGPAVQEFQFGDAVPAEPVAEAEQFAVEQPAGLIDLAAPQTPQIPLEPSAAEPAMPVWPEPASVWPAEETPLEVAGFEMPAAEMAAPVDSAFPAEAALLEPAVEEAPVPTEALAFAPAEPKAPPAPAGATTRAADVDLVLHLEQHQPSAEDAFELSLEEEPAPPVAVSPAAQALPAPVSESAPGEPIGDLLVSSDTGETPLLQPESGFDSLVGALEEELAGMGPAAAALPAAAPPAAAAASAAAPRTAPAAPAVAPPPPAVVPPAPAAPAAARSGGALDDVFAEFKEGMEETGADADIETHFNMGIAFKEMQLWDEAIGEFQKAYQAAERTRNYADYVRCCSLLAHCFQEKGLPALSVRWLENALKAPNLEQESVLALRYEIGAAHEAAGNKKVALESFLEVYALNIDYRDVAERIRELKGN